ncbi:GNAT family N-acetyltransferase [Vibrio kagoshimensis]|uniref:GNAT family N-acetyltransferase n=1 Tax=Vibrio kagoshimensis TaxID=2910244 RepID=UPI003D212A77
MDISLRIANEADIPFLVSLRDQTMRKYLEMVGMPTTSEEYEKRIRYEFVNAQIVQLKGKSIGLFKATYTEELNYWYLVQIQISPEYQGLKIGSKLITDLIGKAGLTNSKVGLSVIKTNPAKQLYSQLGFKVVESSGVEHLMEVQA